MMGWPWLDPARAQALLEQLARGLAILLAGWAVAAGLRALLRRTLSRFVAGHVVTALVAQSAFVAILVVATITGLGSMGLNVSALVASLGLGGFALGFALRDAISNLLAGVLVIVYRPFRPGEHISVAGFEGVVEEINFRYTVLRAEGAYQLIPNQMLFTNPVKVLVDPKSPDSR
jgi:small-conductance mechanosensitive channel